MSRERGVPLRAARNESGSSTSSSPGMTAIIFSEIILVVISFVLILLGSHKSLILSLPY
jgi:hypothetical protein